MIETFDLPERSTVNLFAEWEFEYTPNNCVLICKEKDFFVHYVPEHMVRQTMEMLRFLSRIYDTIKCSYQELKDLFVSNILHIKCRGFYD